MKKDFPFPDDYKGKPRDVFIQWKGTDVCMDWVCDCGELNHEDRDFCYEVQCPKCLKVFAVGSNPKLYLIDTTKYKTWGE